MQLFRWGSQESRCSDRSLLSEIIMLHNIHWLMFGMSFILGYPALPLCLCSVVGQCFLHQNWINLTRCKDILLCGIKLTINGSYLSVLLDWQPDIEPGFHQPSRFLPRRGFVVRGVNERTRLVQGHLSQTVLL
jgi:hypothetical protein